MLSRFLIFDGYSKDASITHHGNDESQKRRNIVRHALDACRYI